MTGPEQLRGILLRNPQPPERAIQPFHEDIVKHCREINGVGGLAELKPEDVYPYQFAVIWGGDGTARTFNYLYYQEYDRQKKTNRKNL